MYRKAKNFAKRKMLFGSLPVLDIEEIPLLVGIIQPK
jgi:hypothetical protein